MTEIKAGLRYYNLSPDVDDDKLIEGAIGTRILYDGNVVGNVRSARLLHGDDYDVLEISGVLYDDWKYILDESNSRIKSIKIGGIE